MNFSSSYGRRPSMNRSFNSGRLILGAVIAVISIMSYLSSQEFNPITGEKQYIGLTQNQEIAMGLQAVPRMMAEYGGEDRDLQAQQLVDHVGQTLVQNSKARDTNWEFDFHLLADRKTVNAFALPGGQIFITRALFDALETEGQLAGVLAHEITHVIARHSAQQIAKQQLAQGLTGAVTTASGSYDAGRLASMVGQMVNMKYGRDDELQSDRFGVLFMSQAGYDPRALIHVMKILERASGGARDADFFSTHPNPDNRIDRITQGIQELFPDGIPSGLKP